MINLNGRKYKGKAAECLLKLYAEGRGLTRTNQEAGDFMDGELANKNNVINQMQNQVTTPQGEFYAGQIYQQGTGYV